MMRNPEKRWPPRVRNTKLAQAFSNHHSWVSNSNGSLMKYAGCERKRIGADHFCRLLSDKEIEHFKSGVEGIYERKTNSAHNVGADHQPDGHHEVRGSSRTD